MSDRSTPQADMADEVDPYATNIRHASGGTFDSQDRGSGLHIRMATPSPSPERQRPPMVSRATLRGQSSRSISDALRLAKSREEQEMLLGDEEQADDDGCFPPRKNDDPRVPNPHAELPVYTTIHRIRRLVIASIGESMYQSESYMQQVNSC